MSKQPFKQISYGVELPVSLPIIQMEPFPELSSNSHSKSSPAASVTLRWQDWRARGAGGRGSWLRSAGGLALLCRLSTSYLLYDEGNTPKHSILRAKSWVVNT